MSEQQGNKANSVDAGGDDKRKPTKRQQATDEDDDHSEKEVRREDDENYNGEKRQGMRRPHEPIVMERGVTGSVKWFSLHKGYGFIRVDGSDDEIFMHASSIIRSVQRPLALAENQKVEFDIIKGPKGFEAICISGPGGMRIGRIIDFGDGRPFFTRYNGPPPRMGINGPHRNRQPAIENKAEEDKSGEKEQNAEAEAKKNGRQEIKKKDAGVEKKNGVAGENVKEEESNKEKKVDQQQRGGGKGKKHRKWNKDMAKKKENGGAGTDEKEQKKQNEEGKEKAANGNEKKADEDKKTETDGKDEESEVEGHSQGQKETGGTAE